MKATGIFNLPKRGSNMEIRTIINHRENLRNFFELVNFDDIDACSYEYINPKATLLRSGDPTSFIWFLVQGEMWAFNHFLNGKKYSTERIIPGDVIGEMEIVAKYPKYISTVTAVSLCLVVKVPSEIYVRWMSTHPRFALSAAYRFASSLCRNATLVGVNNMLTAYESVGMLLCNLYHERNKDNKPLLLAETRQDLADQSGVSVRSVNRVIAKLLEDQHLKLKRGKILMTVESYQSILTNLAYNSILANITNVQMEGSN